MFANRMIEAFSSPVYPAAALATALQTQPQKVLPIVTIENIYQAAAERAFRDYQLDKLFNPDYYGDHGSGI